MTSRFIVPCEPTLRDRLPRGEGWLYEVKFDGYRMQIHKEGKQITLYTCRGADWTARFPHLLEPLHSAVHRRIETGTMLWGFDLMAQNGNDLRAVALEDRKRRLGHLIDRAQIAQLLHSQTFEAGDRILAECEARGLEGVTAKHQGSIYRSGRSTSWIKVKCPSWREANRDRGKLFGEEPGS